MTPDTEDTAGGPVSGQVRVGGYALEVGAPAGFEVTGEPASGTPAEARVIQDALAEGEDAWTQTLSERVDEASDATGKAERAVSLFTAVAEGRLDPATVKAEVDALLDLLDRLDKEGRWEEALDLARSLSGLLGLLMRWSQLVGSLRLALNAAQSLNDLPGVAWAKHELGSLQLVAGETVAAERSLGEARELRQRLGDRRGLAATERNLQTLCRDMRHQLREGRLAPTNGDGFLRRGRVLAALALALLLAGGAAGALAAGSGDDGTDVAPPPREVSVTIRAPVEGAQIRPGARVLADFSCAVEDGTISSCEGDRGDGEPIDTSPGRHTFTVTATTDDGRRATESVSYTVLEEARRDTQDPVVDIVSPRNATVPLRPPLVADFRCLDEPGGSGIASCDATVDGRSIADGERLPMTAGRHTFSVVARDRAGNQTPPRVVTYEVTRAPPSECADKRDNDGDGEIDGSDPGCLDGGVREAEQPQDETETADPPPEPPVD